MFIINHSQGSKLTMSLSDNFLEKYDVHYRDDGIDGNKANHFLYECLLNDRDKLLSQLVASRPVLMFRSLSADTPAIPKSQDSKDLSGTAYFVTGPDQVEHAMRNWSMRHHKYSGEFILSIDDRDDHDRKRRTLVEKLQDSAIALKMDSAVELAWRSAQERNTTSNKTSIIDVRHFARTTALYFVADYFGMPVTKVLDEQGMAKWSSEAFREYIWRIHARHFIKEQPDSLEAIRNISELIKESFYIAPGNSVIGRFRADPGAFINEEGNANRGAIGSNIIGCIQGLIDNVTTSACYAINQFHKLSENPDVLPDFSMESLRSAAVGTSAIPMEQFIFIAHKYDTPAPFLPRYATSELDMPDHGQTIPEGAHVSCAIGPAMQRIEIDSRDRDARDCRMGLGAHDCIGKYVGDQLVVRIARKVILAGSVENVELEKDWGWIVRKCSATVITDQPKHMSSNQVISSHPSVYVHSGATADQPDNRAALEHLRNTRADDIPYLTHNELRAVPPTTFNLLDDTQLAQLSAQQIENLGYLQCQALVSIARDRDHFKFTDQQLLALEKRISFFAVMSKTSSAKSRPHALSLWCASPDSQEIHDYVTWPGLVDKRFTARHLPPVKKEFSQTLPVDEAFDSIDKHGDVTALFRHDPDLHDPDSIQPSRSSLLFPMFAQWFTDSFLRTDRIDRRKNHSSHHVDMCQIYGDSNDVTKLLREGNRGRLKQDEFDGKIFPPRLFDEFGNVKPEFKQLPYVRNGRVNEMIGRWDEVISRKRNFLVSGLARGNATFGNSAMNTLFLREHNRLAGLLAKENPGWNDEKLFQTTRLIVILLELKIVISEYINHIASPSDTDSMEAAGRIFRFDNSYAERQTWYRPNHISLEFNLLYRWHCLVPESVSVDGFEYPLERYINFNDPLIDHGLDAVLLSASSQSINAPGLFSTPDPLLRAEYEALKMSRDYKLQPFNAYREYFGLEKLQTLDDLKYKGDALDRLKRVYPEGIDQLDLLVGMYAERPTSGEVFGELMTAMVAHDAFTQVLTNPLLSKNVLMETTITELGMQVLDETETLDDIWQRNTDNQDESTKNGQAITMDSSQCSSKRVASLM